MEVIFPNEIWLEIFKYIDWQKLMELRLVCHNFYNLIEYLLNKDPQWKKTASKSILFDNLTLTMQRAYPYELVTHMKDIDDPVLWRGTYLSYKKWQKVLINPERKDTIVPVSDLRDIACIATFDKYIAIAFDNGGIANYSITDINRPFYLAYQSSSVIQIEFWYSNGDVLVVTVGDDSVLRFWDLQNKMEIVTGGLFANSISSGECRHFCIGEMDGTLTSYERVGNQITAGPTVNFVLKDDEYLVAHEMDGKFLIALTYIEGYTVMYLYTAIIEDGKLSSFQIDQETLECRMPSNLNASLSRIVAPTIFFFFGIGEDSIGSINYYGQEWYEYNLVEHFGCHVRSMALHAQILMFGLEDGSVHLLHIRHYCDIINLEDTIKNARKIQVDEVPIYDITILEVDKKPCIVAITKQKVHLLNFF